MHRDLLAVVVPVLTSALCSRWSGRGGGIAAASRRLTTLARSPLPTARESERILRATVSTLIGKNPFPRAPRGQELLDFLEAEMDAEGLDALMPGAFMAKYARPRRFEVRTRFFVCTVQYLLALHCSVNSKTSMGARGHKTAHSQRRRNLYVLRPCFVVGSCFRTFSLGSQLINAMTRRAAAADMTRRRG